MLFVGHSMNGSFKVAVVVVVLLLLFLLLMLIGFFISYGTLSVTCTVIIYKLLYYYSHISCGRAVTTILLTWFNTKL